MKMGRMTARRSFERQLKRKDIPFKPLQQLSNVNAQTMDLKQFKGVDFWIWNEQEHARRYKTTNKQCCFNHKIGLPVKGDKSHPMYDYEQTVYIALMNETADKKKDKHVYVLKATGLGVTEFCLRWIAWMCLKDDKLKGSQVVIITSPSISVATGLIKRLRGLFPDVSFPEKETDCTLNGTTIRAFPSHLGLDSARGLERPSIIFVDEAGFAPISMIPDIRSIVLERWWWREK